MVEGLKLNYCQNLIVVVKSPSAQIFFIDRIAYHFRRDCPLTTYHFAAGQCCWISLLFWGHFIEVLDGFSSNRVNIQCYSHQDHSNLSSLWVRGSSLISNELQKSRHRIPWEHNLCLLICQLLAQCMADLLLLLLLLILILILMLITVSVTATFSI